MNRRTRLVAPVALLWLCTAGASTAKYACADSYYRGEACKDPGDTSAVRKYREVERVCDELGLVPNRCLIRALELRLVGQGTGLVQPDLKSWLEEMDQWAKCDLLSPPWTGISDSIPAYGQLADLPMAQRYRWLREYRTLLAARSEEDGIARLDSFDVASTLTSYHVEIALLLSNRSERPIPAREVAEIRRGLLGLVGVGATKAQRDEVARLVSYLALDGGNLMGGIAYAAITHLNDGGAELSLQTGDRGEGYQRFSRIAEENTLRAASVYSPLARHDTTRYAAGGFARDLFTRRLTQSVTNDRVALDSIYALLDSTYKWTRRMSLCASPANRDTVSLYTDVLRAVVTEAITTIVAGGERVHADRCLSVADTALRRTLPAYQLAYPSAFGARSPVSPHDLLVRMVERGVLRTIMSDSSTDKTYSRSRRALQDLRAYCPGAWGSDRTSWNDLATWVNNQTRPTGAEDITCGECCASQ